MKKKNKTWIIHATELKLYPKQGEPIHIKGVSSVEIIDDRMVKVFHRDEEKQKAYRSLFDADDYVGLTHDLIEGEE